MVEAEDPAELALVVQAIQRCEEWVGSFVWNGKAAKRIQEEIPNLPPETIRELVVELVCRTPEVVRQVPERREFNRRFYYKVILPVPAMFKHGLFVEMILVIPDPDYPGVEIVNAHEQRR